MITQFSGKVALVTGGASGIGRAAALEFARAGADLVITDLNEARLAEVEAEVTGLGRRIACIRADVTSDVDWDRVVEAAATIGDVDLLMLNAGMSVLGPVDLIPMEQWQKQFDVNFFGIVRGVQRFVPGMRARRRGHVVVVASVAGRYSYSFNAGPYVASKFAAYGLSENLALYLKPHGIGVTAVCPGLVVTNLGENAVFGGFERGTHDNWHSFPAWMMNPMTPEQVGAQIIDAVRNDKFLLYTHAEDEELLRQRGLDVDAAIAKQIADLPSPVFE